MASSKLRLLSLAGNVIRVVNGFDVVADVLQVVNAVVVDVVAYCRVAVIAGCGGDGDDVTVYRVVVLLLMFLKLLVLLVLVLVVVVK